MINTQRWHDWISGFSNGTTIDRLPKDVFEMPWLVVPPRKLVERFSEFADESADRIESNRLQSATLTALHDTLLPKLLSGDMSVEEAENGVRSAGTGTNEPELVGTD